MEAPSVFIGSVLASKGIMAKKKAAPKKKTLAPPPADPRAKSRSRSPAATSVSKKKNSLNKMGSSENLNLDHEMSKVNDKLGGNKQCLKALVVERHLAGEKLGVRLQAAAWPFAIFPILHTQAYISALPARAVAETLAPNNSEPYLL